MKPHLICIAILCSSAVFVVNAAVSQRNKRQDFSTTEDPLVQLNIDALFGPQSTGSSVIGPSESSVRPRPRPGPTDIVTPDPNYQPTTGPTILTINDQTCTCVPYHRCDPNTNNITTYNDAPNDDEVTGFGVIDIRFGERRDCEDFLDVCCTGGAQAIESFTPKPDSRPTFEAGCGVRNVNGLDFEITGAVNNEAGFGEFPWTVAIIKIEDDALICGGSLIHPKAVLTGNHCVRDYVYKAKDLKIRAGEWDTQRTKERLPYQEIAVSRIFSHPNYNERSLANDIAVVELENPFQIGPHINTVCLPQLGLVPNQQDCFASGWGKDVFGKAGKYSVILKKIPLPIADFNLCQTKLQEDRLGPKFRLDPSFICAGGIEGVDTCQGDGGAPLVCPIGRLSENRYAQNGIVAWGLGCNKPIPGVYANVALARSWIDQQFGVLGLDTSYYTY